MGYSSRYNPKPPVDLRNQALRDYLIESYVDFGLLAHDIIVKLKAAGVTEPFILEAVAQATVNQPVVYRVQEFYAQPMPKQDARTEQEAKRIAGMIGK